MTVLSGGTIRSRCLNSDLITPFNERTAHEGLTFGLSMAGYDIRIAENHWIDQGAGVVLASSIERFSMPLDLVGRVHDKSTWARKGLFVQNTIIEPGWRGYLTLELTYHGRGHVRLQSGTPIAQIVFELLDQPAEYGYAGKYQNQPAYPIHAIFDYEME